MIPLTTPRGEARSVTACDEVSPMNKMFPLRPPPGGALSATVNPVTAARPCGSLGGAPPLAGTSPDCEAARGSESLVVVG